jgi:O-methyltransferase / aklanonic acid methyltransferase
MTDEEVRKREESLRIFSQAATTYDRIGPRIFSHFGQRLVDLAEIAPGVNVLDVAAGRGAVLFPAAAKVGPNGHVIGVDFSPEMVRETLRDIERQKLSHAEIRQMDAEQMNFPDARFDWVTCGFALWMFAQPCRVLGEFWRLLRRGGRVRLSTWAADTPFQNWCHEVLRPYAPASASEIAGSKDDAKFDTQAALEKALQQAGFADIQITVEEKAFAYANEQEFWLSLWSSGIRRQLEKMPAAVVEKAKSEVFLKLQAFKKADGFYKVNRALFAFGTKPG